MGRVRRALLNSIRAIPTSPRPSPPPEDVSDGFLDKTEVTCPMANDIVNGVLTAGHGYRIIADKDGDKASLVFQGKGTAPGRICPLISKPDFLISS
jgi:hypothetical protein